jgi:hypothetical protein
VKTAKSGLPVKEISSVRINVRTAYCLKVIRQEMPEHARGSS